MVMICYGTRPEVIKVAPVIAALRRREIPHLTVFTGQHKELYEDVSSLVPTPDYHLQVMKANQSINHVLSSILTKLQEIFTKQQVDIVLVQGDTSTVVAAAIAAFNNQIPIGHIEAGLRTHRLDSPFPEEGNRQIVSRISTFNWVPTEIAANNLLAEGVKNIILTGNTVIDTCKSFDLDIVYGNKVLITLHRRENHGERLLSMCQQLEQLANKHPELSFIFPMHPNPNVQQYRSVFSKVSVVEPLKYSAMIQLLSEVKFVISDSGGIQEECAAFKKKILVCRDSTERPEGIEAGFAKLIGTNILNNFSWANNSPHWNGKNPYGNGNASIKIVDTIAAFLHKKNKAVEAVYSATSL